MRRLLRVLKVLGKGILVLIVGVVAALLILRWTFTRQLNAEIAAIRARGEPLTVADFSGPEIPDSENAAAIYAKAFNEIPAGEDFWTLMEQVDQALEAPAPGSLDKARRLLQPYAHLFALVEQATARPDCRFATDLTHVELSSWPQTKLRRLSALLRRQALLNALSGRMDEAMRSVELAFEISESLKNETGTLPMLSRIGMIIAASDCLRKVAERGDITETQARRLYDILGRLDLEDGYIRAIQWERAYFLHTTTAQRENPLGWVQDQYGHVSWRHMLAFYANPTALAWCKVFLIGDQAAYMRFMSELVESADLTYKGFSSKRFDEGQGVPPYAILTRMLGPVYGRSFGSCCRSRAEVAGSQILLALVAYHERYGSYPGTLDELRTRLGWKLPPDPYTGEPFVYRRSGKGFLLLSVGPNLKDDGGRPQPREYTDQYDISWQRKR